MRTKQKENISKHKCSSITDNLEISYEVDKNVKKIYYRKTWYLDYIKIKDENIIQQVESNYLVGNRKYMKMCVFIKTLTLTVLKRIICINLPTTMVR